MDNVKMKNIVEHGHTAVCPEKTGNLILHIFQQCKYDHGGTNGH